MPHYFVDGYNVIRKSDALSAGSLRDQRERFVNFIESRRPQGRAGVTVVFDGRADVSSPRWPGPTRVVFSPGKDADAVLKRFVDDLKNPRDAVVVTDDRSIQRWVRAAGARIMGAREFLSAGAAPAARRPASLALHEAEEINEELKRIWKLK